MAFFFESVSLLALLVACVYAISLGSNSMLRSGLMKYLDDDQFMPSPQSDDYAYILESRRIVRQYFGAHCHQAREMIAMAGCLLIALLSWQLPELGTWISYLALSAIVALNEVVLYVLRNKRDVALLSIEG